MSEFITQAGKAHNKCPANFTLLTDTAILQSPGFEHGVDKHKVPRWLDGDAGRLLQIRMASLLGERYFDYGCCSDESSSGCFRPGGSWSAFARMHPFILTCFEDAFGLNHTLWGPQPAARWKEIMRGVWDLEIQTFSDSIPDTSDKEEPGILQTLTHIL